MNLRFTEVVEHQLLVGIEEWEGGVPGQEGTWSMASMAHRAWDAMFTKLRALVER